MPIYEYRCQECRRISSFLILNLHKPFTPACRQCGSHSLERILSRVHVRLSEESRLERLADVLRQFPASHNGWTADESRNQDLALDHTPIHQPSPAARDGPGPWA